MLVDGYLQPTQHHLNYFLYFTIFICFCYFVCRFTMKILLSIYLITELRRKLLFLQGISFLHTLLLCQCKRYTATVFFLFRKEKSLTTVLKTFSMDGIFILLSVIKLYCDGRKSNCQCENRTFFSKIQYRFALSHFEQFLHL